MKKIFIPTPYEGIQFDKQKAKLVYFDIHETSVSIQGNNPTSSAFIKESSPCIADLLSSYSSVSEKWMLYDLLRGRNALIYFQSLDDWIDFTLVSEEEGRRKKALLDIQILEQLEIQNLIAMCNPIFQSLKHQRLQTNTYLSQCLLRENDFVSCGSENLLPIQLFFLSFCIHIYTYIYNNKHWS